MATREELIARHVEQQARRIETTLPPDATAEVKEAAVRRLIQAGLLHPSIALKVAEEVGVAVSK